VSQRSVETFLGRLATDEGLRVRFRGERGAVLDELEAGGALLTPVERRALLTLDLDAWERFADGLDPRLQKVCCRRSRSEGRPKGE
jgi:hypothetical protein